jgi:anthranilate phosphoribosyltransferase
MADTLAGMEIERAFVVHGEPGWDEPTPVGPFALFDVRRGRVQRGERNATMFGLESCRAEALAGGDANFNAAAVRAVFEGRDRGAHRDALVLGTALVLELTGRVGDPYEGVALAAEAIESGRAGRLLNQLAQFEGGTR